MTVRTGTCHPPWKTYPLNQSQISIFTEEVLKLVREKGQITAWDLYNVATEIYKPGRTDFPALIPQNGAMAELLLYPSSSRGGNTGCGSGKLNGYRMKYSYIFAASKPMTYQQPGQAFITDACLYYIILTI